MKSTSDDPAKVRVGEVDLFLPDASDPDFWFSHDVAGMLSVEFNTEARAVLNRAIREDGDRPPGRVSIDNEADAVFVRARCPEPIVHVLVVLHRLAGVPLDPSQVSRALEAARAWRRPAPKAWKLGDVFTLPLRDGSFAFGQVVGRHLVKSPTLLLFDGRAEVPLPTEQIVELGFITILHAGGTCLETGEFAVIDGAEVCADPASGPWGAGGVKSTSDQLLQEVANAWFGFEPWNGFRDERRFESLLYGSRERPATAWVLSEVERRRHLRERFGIGDA